MDRIAYTSILSDAYKRELENLLFFNAKQNQVRGMIATVIEKYGSPTVGAEGGRLRISLKGDLSAQCLFALTSVSPRLIGAAIYLRQEFQTLSVLHIAVNYDYSSTGFNSEMLVFPRFLARLLSIAGSIKGVDALRLLYLDGFHLDLPARQTRKT